MLNRDFYIVFGAGMLTGVFIIAVTSAFLLLWG